MRGKAQREPGDEDGADADRHVDPEGPAPAGALREPAAEERADDGGDPEERTHRTHVLAALTRRHDVRDDRLGQDHESTAAEALHGAPGDELDERAGEPGAGRAEREQGDRDDERPAASDDVADLAVQRHDDGDGQDVGGDDPALVLHAVELPDDRGHRGADDRLVERGQEHGRHEGAEDEPDGALGEDHGGLPVRRVGLERVSHCVSSFGSTGGAPDDASAVETVAAQVRASWVAASGVSVRTSRRSWSRVMGR